MVTVAVISILAAIGYPAYTNYTYKARRTEATGSLLDFATRMERYYADNNSYNGATVGNIMGGASTEHGMNSSENRKHARMCPSRWPCK